MDETELRCELAKANEVIKMLETALLQASIDIHNLQTQIGGWRWIKPLTMDDVRRGE